MGAGVGAPFFPILLWIRSCFKCLADGVWPSVRHDGKPWNEQDSTRANKAGLPLLARGVLIQLKGDWAEFCQRLGYPTWTSSLRPCFLCAAAPDTWYETRGVSLLGLPWHSNSDEDYSQACAVCEFPIRVTRVLVLRIKAVLRYDKRVSGALGRCLTAPLPDLGLREGDRLEPNENLPDVGMFENLCEDLGSSTTVVFWRRSLETIALHRCPLWDASLGITPTRVLCIDILHTLHLGVMQEFAKLALWTMLLSGVWGGLERTEGEAFQVAVLCLRAELFAWYKTFSVQHPTEILTRLADLTPKMLGTPDRRKLKTKGAETYGVLCFLDHALRKYAAAIGADSTRLLEGATTLLRFMSICRTSGKVLTAAQQQELLDCVKRHMVVMSKWSIYRPKHHLLLHLAHRAGHHGNPVGYSTFLDESLNKQLKRVLANCSQLTFEASAYAKMSVVLRTRAKRQRVL